MLHLLHRDKQLTKSFSLPSRMKVKAPNLLKKIIAAFSSKTNELRIRLMIFFLLHKNLDTTSITSSLQALVSHHPHHHKKKKNDDDNAVDEEEEEEEEGRRRSLLMNYNKATSMMLCNNNTQDMSVVEDMPRISKAKNHDDDQQRTMDLTHALFKESEAAMEKEGDTEEAVESRGERTLLGGGVAEEEEEEIMGEEDIDQAADMFIQRFKKQMLLQKQRSLERQQWLLLSNA